jgi:hypothetical protein
MANATAAFGLRPVRHLSGDSWNGRTQRAYISSVYATALYVGDPVIYSPTLTHKEAGGNYPTIIQSGGTTGLIVIGAIVAFEPLRSDLTKVYNPASTERWALITPLDPTIVFHIRDDGSGTPTKVFPGQNAEMANAGGSTVTGMSGFALDASTPTTTQAFPLHIIGLAPKEDNELDDYAIWEVTLNTIWNATGNILGVTAA